MPLSTGHKNKTKAWRKSGLGRQSRGFTQIAPWPSAIMGTMLKRAGVPFKHPAELLMEGMAKRKAELAALDAEIEAVKQTSEAEVAAKASGG